jgi:hypothetical protein
MPRFLGAGKGLRETRSWPTGCRRNPNTAGEIMTKDGVSVLVGSSVRDVAIQLLNVLPAISATLACP